MIQHAFATFDTVQFCIGPDNARSIAAVQKLGASFQANVKDMTRPDSVFYAVTRSTYVGLNEYGIQH